MAFRKIEPRALQENPFRLFGADWMLLSAGDRQENNTMTVGWGGLGVLWGMNVATCYVRPDRYTYKFMEKSEYFTLAAFDESRRSDLVYCGTASGRDENKLEKCGFHLAFAEGDAPYAEEARLVPVCRKLYAQDFDPALFRDARIEEKCYAGHHQYHRQYIGEIVEALIKD